MLGSTPDAQIHPDTTPHLAGHNTRTATNNTHNIITGTIVIRLADTIHSTTQTFREQQVDADHCQLTRALAMMIMLRENPRSLEL